MLTWDPSQRCTVVQALAHPYLAAFHNPEAEPVAAAMFDFDDAPGESEPPALESESPWVPDSKRDDVDDDDDDDSAESGAASDSSLWSGFSAVVRTWGRLPKKRIVDKFVEAVPDSGFTRKEVEARLA